MAFPKLVFNHSFAFGDIPLVSLADDPSKFRKSAARLGSSPVVEQWGRVDPIPGHTLVHLLALSDFEKSGNNANGDAFREAHVKEVHPSFVSHGALYKDHKSRGPKYGQIIKSAHNDVMGRTELLVAHDNDKCAEWLGKIERGEPAAYSMGYSCSSDQCSLKECSKIASNRSEYCDHVKRGARAPYGMNRILPDGRKCFVFNIKGHFNDISMVPVGADPIAFSLRKVAGLGEDEVMGGADLAEAYLGTQNDGAPDVAKLALARKLSMIEKRLDAAGIHSYQRRQRDVTPISKEARDTLRSAPAPDMFAELAKVGAVLPPHDFFALIFGDEFPAHRAVIDKVAAHCVHAFSALEEDFERLTRVCGNYAYDAAPRGIVTGAVLKRAGLDEYARAFALDPALSGQRAFEAAAVAKLAAAGDDPGRLAPDPRTDYLVDQYAAYKLAALAAIEADDNRLFAATLEA